jgi:hypothetical protein
LKIYFKGDSKSGKKPELATVVAPYSATGKEQLTLQRGQMILVRKKTDTGWWQGEIQAVSFCDAILADFGHCHVEQIFIFFGEITALKI